MIEVGYDVAHAHTHTHTHSNSYRDTQAHGHTERDLMPDAAKMEMKS